MHGFRDNEVLLQTGYDVIVTSPLRVVSGDFFGMGSERATMTSNYWLMVSFVLTQMDWKFFDIFSLHGIPLLAVKYWGFWGKMTPRK